MFEDSPANASSGEKGIFLIDLATGCSLAGRLAPVKVEARRAGRSSENAAHPSTLGDAYTSVATAFLRPAAAQNLCRTLSKSYYPLRMPTRNPGASYSRIELHLHA